jgi:hypothetical protein
MASKTRQNQASGKSKIHSRKEEPRCSTRRLERTARRRVTAKPCFVRLAAHPNHWRKNQKKGFMTNDIYKGIAVFSALVISFFVFPVVRERRGKELTDDDKDVIFGKIYPLVIFALILILLFLFYWNNRPW